MQHGVWTHVLIPGRHHGLTRFQADWIKGCQEGRWVDSNGETIVTDETTTWVFLITSANHDTTRRNPVPLSRRIAQVELFGFMEGIRILTVPVTDTPQSPRFAEYCLETCKLETGLDLTPSSTLIAVSTEVADLYKALGYATGGIEKDGKAGTPTAWDIVVAASEDNLEQFTKITHPASLNVWERYGLRELVQRVFKDEILVTDDGAITDTRNYGTYSKAFIETAQRKWVEVKDWVKPGRILDIGCASGQILLEAGKEERLQSSDLIGVEADRWLHAEAVHRKNQGHFKNPSTFFYKGNILENHLFTPRSINTTLTLALTHEIYSYGDKEEDLQKLSDAILLHTRPDGVWINSDTAGPQQPGREVDLWLSLTDKEPGKNQEQVNQAAGMSTSHKFWEYCKDLQELTGRKIPVTIVECKVEHQGTPMEVVRVNLKEAMEYLLHKDYTDNWVSELHETYTYRNWEDWKKHLTQSGWEILPGSGGYTNQWIVENRLEGHARITDPGTGTRIPWPDTHMRFAVKPA